MSDTIEEKELISPEEFKAYAITKNIDVSKLSNDDITNLIQLTADDLSSQTSLDISPVDREELLKNPTFNNEEHILGYYPVDRITEIIVNGVAISENDYQLDKSSGIIYFSKVPSGDFVIIKYISKVSDSYFKSKIRTLLLDLLFYNLNNDPRKGASSVKEGDVSVNYDTNSSEYSRLASRIDKIRNSFVRSAILE